MGEFLHFLGVGHGSALEVETQPEIARREKYGDSAIIDHAQSLAEEVIRILNASLTTTRERRKRHKSTVAS